MTHREINDIAAALLVARPLNSVPQLPKAVWNGCVRNVAHAIKIVKPASFRYEDFYSKCGGLYYR